MAKLNFQELLSVSQILQKQFSNALKKLFFYIIYVKNSCAA